MEEEIFSEDSADLSRTESPEQVSDGKDRDEYDELIKTKYKQFYTEDTQKIINKRFRKYKELEEYVKKLEEERAQFEQRLKSEVEKSAKEAEDRLISSIREKHARPDENGIFNSRLQGKKDISSLSRTERADMAKRASMGETIII